MRAILSRQTLPAGCVLGWLLALAGAGGAFAGDRQDVPANVAIVRPMIGETTALVVKIDPQRLALPDLEEFLEQRAPEALGAYRQWNRTAADGIAVFRAATGDQPVYGTIGIPISQIEQPVFFFLRRTPGVDENVVREHVTGAAPDFDVVIREELLVAGPGIDGDLAAALDALVPSPRDELGDAFEAVAAHPIQVLLLPPDYVRRTVVELMPQLPRQLGGGPSEVLTEGLLWAAMGLDPGRLQFELIIQSTSEAAARRVGEHLPVLVRSIYREAPDWQRRLPPEELLLPLIAPAVDGDRIVLRIERTEPEGGIMGLFAAVAAVQEQMRPTAQDAKFKQILLAMHNYHDTFAMLPPRDDVRDDQGRTGLSWRVHLLPFLDQQQLYQQFRLDEPWDSDHNRPLIARMPDIYRSPAADVPPGHTTFLAPVGEDSVFGGPKATRLADIRDGTSNTVVLVEVKPDLAVPWTAPEDYDFDPEAPGRGLQTGDDGRFTAGFADGSVRRLRADVDPDLLLRLFQKSSGRPVDWKALD